MYDDNNIVNVPRVYLLCHSRSAEGWVAGTKEREGMEKREIVSGIIHLIHHRLCKL